MDFGQMFRVLWRRWRVSVPVLLLTAAAIVLAYVKWPGSYQSTAEITLISPKSTATAQGGGDNPFLDVGSLNPMAGILASSLSSQQTADQLRALGVQGSFEAALPPFAAGPFLELSLSGTDPAAVSKSMPTVIRFSADRLQAIQQTGLVHRLDSAAVIRSVVIAQPSTPHLLKKAKYQAAGGAAVLGVAALVLFGVGAEARARRRVPAPARVPGNEAVAGRAALRAEFAHGADRQAEAGG